MSCKARGKRQELSNHKIMTEWDDLELPIAWYGYTQDTAFAASDYCAGELDRLGKGEWVATHPEREISGYHLTKLFSSHRDLLAVVKGL